MTTHTSVPPGAPGPYDEPGAPRAYDEPGSGPSDAGSGPSDAASAAASAAKQHAGQFADTAKEQAATVADEVKHQTRDLVDEARTQVRQQVGTQRDRVNDLLREISEDLEQMAGRSDRNGVAADLVRQAAARTRSTRAYLDGGGDVFADVRRFARRKPGTFLLGALAAGVLAGRATRAAAAARRAGPPTGDAPAVDQHDVQGSSIPLYPQELP